MNQISQISTEELSAFLVGDLDAAAAERIEQLASADEELAAKIAVMRLLLGSTAADQQRTIGPVHVSDEEQDGQATDRDVPVHSCSVRPGPRLPRLRRMAIAAVIFIIVAACVSGSWAWIARLRPALEDDFNARAIHPRKWQTLRKEVWVENGYLALRNRGYVVTYREFSGPLMIDLDWQPLDLAKHARYLDILTIALHTTPVHREEHSYEAVEGLLVKFNAQSHDVSVSDSKDVHSDYGLGRSPDMSALFPTGDWQHLRIVDDGGMVSVFVGPSAAEMPDEPVLRVPYNPADFPGARIAIYNRELVGDANHESHIDNIVIQARAW